MALTISKIAAILAGVGYVGHAAYQAFVLHDLPSAATSVATAAATLGITGVAIHGVTPQPPK